MRRTANETTPINKAGKAIASGEAPVTALCVAPTLAASPVAARVPAHRFASVAVTSPVASRLNAPVVSREAQSGGSGGFWSGFGSGLYDMGAGLWNLATHPIATTQKAYTGIKEKGVSGVWDALKDPYTSRWGQGDYGGAFGYGAANLLPMLLTDGLGAVAKGGELAEIGGAGGRVAGTLPKLGGVAAQEGGLGAAQASVSARLLPYMDDLAVESRMAELRQLEALNGGHAMERHLGWTTEQLDNRLLSPKAPDITSTFTNDRAFLQAYQSVQASAEYEAALQNALGLGQSSFSTRLPLESAYGMDYASHVYGRQLMSGAGGASKAADVGFEGGNIFSKWKFNSAGTPYPQTMYPSPFKP